MPSAQFRQNKPKIVRYSDPLPGLERISFDAAVAEADGDVPIRGLGSLHESGSNILAGLPAGRKHTPGTHPYPVTVHVLEGTGTFHVGGFDRIYEASDVFEVGQNVLHGFVHVTTATLFVKHAETVRPN